MRFKKVFCTLTVFLLIISLCGCKNKKNQSSEQMSSEVSDAVVTVSEVNDLADPENNDYKTESGTEVKAEELTDKKGLAHGIDVSKWQGKINWSKVKKTGMDFAIIRIGFRGENGTIYKDPYADYNIQQAEKAGLLIGVYFFSTAVTSAEAKAEAEWTVSNIRGYPISYPVVYNSEGFLNADSRMYNLSNSQRTDNALAFLDYVKGQGYDSMFYAASSELTDSLYWDTERLQSSHKIWVARYPVNPYPQTQNPDYSGKYDMWQYTDKGRVSGINGNADMVVSYFTAEKSAPKKESERPKDSAPPTPEDKLYTAVSDEVTAKNEVNLRDAATTKSNIIAVLKNGTFVKRTATGSNGWSKLEYDGKTVYAITSYLTTDRSYKPHQNDNDDGFKSASGQLTAKDTTNLRAKPTVESDIIATIKNGEFATRTGVSDSGWTRLSYKGQTVYAKTSLLTDKVNEAPPVSSESQPVNDGFAAATGRVTAKNETNLRSAPSTAGTEVIYTLKNGEFAELVGKSAKGWSKVIFDGKTLYAVSSYLITEEEYKTQSE